MKSEKLLLIDDDQAIHQIVQSLAPELGFEVEIAPRGSIGLELGLKGEHELVILDLGLPDIGGIAVLEKLREAQPALPVLLLTSRSSELDKVLGLQAGADDYLTKPFGSQELVARVRSLLRRKRAYQQQSSTAQGDDASVLEIEDLVINFSRRSISRGGNELEFSSLEFDIISYLAAHRGRVISRDELLTQVWGYSETALNNYSATVSTSLSRIRTKLEPNPEKPVFIFTVRGVGYRFVDG